MMLQTGSNHAVWVLLAALGLGACAHAPCPPGVAPSEAPAASAPAPANTSAADPFLVGFARATCFAVYLEEKGWDGQSARNIGGGYLELGSASAEAYAALSSFIRGFEPPLGSQQPTDAHLSRCFQIEDDAEWQRLVRAH
ncbi:MAG TPA: hypothetical protein VMG12_22135 [Polyangiaceae bacterium]|nr:hypothetical protein [Polyangiaceae bacterium]